MIKKKWNLMSEEWPYEPKKDLKIKTLEKDINKIKTQLYQTLLNANKTVVEMQKLTDELNKCQIKNSKLESEIEALNTEIRVLKTAWIVQISLNRLNHHTYFKTKVSLGAYRHY